MLVPKVHLSKPPTSASFASSGKQKFAEKPLPLVSCKQTEELQEWWDQAILDPIFSNKNEIENCNDLFSKLF